MSKEYLVPPNPNIGMGPQPQMQPQPPKKDNRIVMLLSVILVLLLAIITFIVVVSLKPKDGQNENPSDGMTSADSATQNSATASPNSQQPQSNPQSQNGQSTPAPNTNQGGSENMNKTLTKSEFIRFLNEESAKAAKGSYKLKRTGVFVKAIDVGNATNALNTIIQGVDKNADLNSVVGGFLGIKKDPIVGTASNGTYEGFEAKYALKAMTLTDSDVIAFQANESGTQYTIQIADCNVPSANSALAHITNDYITFAEVNENISNSVGDAVKVDESSSTANYTQITFVVTVADGKITKITYSYTLSATLKIKLTIMSATGTFEADIKGEYTDIWY